MMLGASIATQAVPLAAPSAGLEIREPGTGERVARLGPGVSVRDGRTNGERFVLPRNHSHPQTGASGPQITGPNHDPLEPAYTQARVQLEGQLIS